MCSPSAGSPPSQVTWLQMPKAWLQATAPPCTSEQVQSPSLDPSFQLDLEGIQCQLPRAPRAGGCVRCDPSSSASVAGEAFPAPQVALSFYEKLGTPRDIPCLCFFVSLIPTQSSPKEKSKSPARTQNPQLSRGSPTPDGACSTPPRLISWLRQPV